MASVALVACLAPCFHERHTEVRPGGEAALTTDKRKENSKGQAEKIATGSEFRKEYLLRGFKVFTGDEGSARKH